MRRGTCRGVGSPPSAAPCSAADGAASAAKTERNGKRLGSSPGVAPLARGTARGRAQSGLFPAEILAPGCAARRFMPGGLLLLWKVALGSTAFVIYIRVANNGRPLSARLYRIFRLLPCVRFLTELLYLGPCLASNIVQCLAH